MSVRLAKKEDIRTYYKMLSYCFNSGNANIENNVNNANFPSDEILVNEIDGKVCQCTHVVPFMIHFDQKVYPMGGIAGVSSYPENRDSGGIKDILIYSLQYMKERGMIFSALGPFAFEFYRKYGWEWGFVFQKIKFPIADIAKTPKAHHYKELTKEDDELIDNFRNQFVSKLNGSVLHSSSIRENRWQSFYHQFMHCYAAYNENNQIESIAFFKIENRTLICDELFYVNETGRQHMLHFFYVHRSQVDFVELLMPRNDNLRMLLPNPRIQYWEWANMMFRVVVAKEAFKAMKINFKTKGKFRLKVNDLQAPWNHQVFELFVENGTLDVKEWGNSKAYDFEISIQRLSQLVLGFMSGEEAIQLEVVHIKSPNKIDLFKKVFTKRPTMLWQMF